VASDAELDYIQAYFVGKISARYNGKKLSGALIEGNTSQIADVENLSLLDGRFFTDGEDERAAHVCVLGHDAWDTLFDGQPAVGREITVETGLYTVIGVLDKEKQPFGSGKNPNDNSIHFSIKTFQTLHPEVRDLAIGVKYDDPHNKDLVEDEVRELVRIRRKVKVQAPDNFEISSPDALSKLWGQLTGGLVAFMIAVSSVGLMVGGVGVMNIMLVCVTERTREIGVRAALGASRSNILAMILRDGLRLTAFGILIGLGGAVVASHALVTMLYGISRLDWMTYLGVVTLLTTVAGIACWIPAWRAARVDPSITLRAE
jgi:putative ABC transport system permease protein